jgi:hypothetical protein
VSCDLDDRIAALERELVELRRARTDRTNTKFLLTLEHHIPAGVVFSAVDLLRHSRLHPALANAIGDVAPKVLGRRLARISRRGARAPVVLECLGRDEHGCMWTLRVTG